MSRSLQGHHYTREMSKSETELGSTKAHHDAPDWLVLTIACIAQFMVVLDVSIVNVALPSMGRDLHFTYSSAQWVINAYVLTFAGFLLLGGRAADYLRSAQRLSRPASSCSRWRASAPASPRPAAEMIDDSRNSGRRRCDPVARDAHHHRHDLPGTTASQGHRRLERQSPGAGGAVGGLLGGILTGTRLVAMDLLHQRALRHRRRHGRRDVPARDAQRGRHLEARRHRLGARDRRPRVGDLRRGEHHVARLDLVDRRSAGCFLGLVLLATFIFWEGEGGLAPARAVQDLPVATAHVGEPA